MSQEFNDAPLEYGTYSWSQVFLSAITRPSLETYTRLVRDPNASANKAYLWVFVSSTLAYAIYFLLTEFVGRRFLTNPFEQIDTAPGLFVVGLLFVCCSPVIGIFSVVAMAMQVAITQFFARLMGGTGRYSQLLYGMTAFAIPISIISLIIAAFAISTPFVAICVSLPLSVYSLILRVTAVNAVNECGWGKAIVSGILLPIAIVVIVGCGVIFILSLLGPQIGDVFSEIIRSMQTPVSTGA